MDGIVKTVINGKTAYVITDFEYEGKKFCLYGIMNDKNDYDIYYAQVIDNTIIPCNPDDKELISQISSHMVSIFKDSKGRGK